MCSWTISNITAGTADQIQAVIESNIIPPLVSILKNEEFDIQKEAAWAISNATSGGRDEQLQYLIQQGVIPPLCELFNCPDAKIILVAMEGLENLLRVGKNETQMTGTDNKVAELVEECGGLDALEALQRHDNSEIYEKSVRLLHEYFEVEGDDQGIEDMAPQQNNQQFSFGGNGGAANAGQQGGFNFGGQ